MSFPVIKKASYILVNTPDMMIHNGSTQTMERETNPDSEYLKHIREHLRSFEQVVAYAPNQVYIGNMTPEELSEKKRPWYNESIENAARYGKFGEIMPQDEFYGLLKVSDVFDLVLLEKSFTERIKEKFSKHPVLRNKVEVLRDGHELAEIQRLVDNHTAEALYEGESIVGCVKRAHEFDKNLSSHVMIENLSVKASGALALMYLTAQGEVKAEEIDYIIECSEEAIGDMNQRGGGNVAKSIGEIAGFKNATGVDMRGFCAGPVHSLITASALVKAGVYKNVAIVGGGATAKLGMNGRDHFKKNLPILEDCLGGFALLISEDDGVNPVLRTDIIGKHNIGHGASPQAVLEALVLEPLNKQGLKITDIDKYAPEMQIPDLTEPAGAGDVPTQNYKMIGALAVKNGQLDKKELPQFVVNHGYPGFAPTQGHIPSGVPIIGHAREHMLEGKMNRFMVIGKGSLFLGRMTNLFDGVSIVVEKNPERKDSKSPREAAKEEVKTEFFNNKADGSKIRNLNRKIRIGLTTFGSEHGVDEVVKGAELALNKYSDFEVVLIGPEVNSNLKIISAVDAEDGHKKMLELLETGEIDGCVTQHFDFPVGVSTIGKVVTPAIGKDMIIASTTGAASTNRVEAMIMNAISGISVAKALGIKNPKLGILNLDGARQVERMLRELKVRGYKFEFSDSLRIDGGALMRGNDLLAGSPDVMVCDSLTGNLLVKIFSSFTTGGNYETLGAGYGPGIGENYNKLINIVSRASGAPLIAEALRFSATCAQNNLLDLAAEEFKKAEEAGLKELITGNIKEKNKNEITDISIPPKKIVTYPISGIDILELEEACKMLWREGIYSESGMGCTGPIVLVNEEDGQKAEKVLTKGGIKG